MIVFGLFFLLINLNLVFAFQARNYLHNRITKHSNYHHFKVPCCESQNQRSFKLAFGTSDIATAFNVATFLPQPFWLLMILAPNSDLTKKLMGSWFSLLSFSLVHLFIVIVSASQEDGTAPIAEFSKVFDPAGNPLQGMLGMMTYPNFVSEEWSHVLTWDLFVGRWIWLDGIERGVFTPHSVLLTNLIGPPGLLLHFITCFLSGKGLPPQQTSQE